MKLTNIYYFVLAEKRCMAFAVRVGVNMSKSVSASSQSNKCVCVIALRMFCIFLEGHIGTDLETMVYMSVILVERLPVCLAT